MPRPTVYALESNDAGAYASVALRIATGQYEGNVHTIGRRNRPATIRRVDDLPTWDEAVAWADAQIAEYEGVGGGN